VRARDRRRDHRAEPQELPGLVLHCSLHSQAAAIHGKTELIEARYGGLLVRLGAFPVRRGQSDADALESGAPLVPCAITGTERLFLGPLPKPRRVQVAFSEPIHVAQLAATPEAAARVVDEALWPEVEGEFQRLRALPTLVAAALAAIGIGGGLLVRRRRRPRSRLRWRR
jgi:1-acyl-sn-glycerol-3-phosphate acyltransferase